MSNVAGSPAMFAVSQAGIRKLGQLLTSVILITMPSGWIYMGCTVCIPSNNTYWAPTKRQAPCWALGMKKWVRQYPCLQGTQSSGRGKQQIITVIRWDNAVTVTCTECRGHPTGQSTVSNLFRKRQGPVRDVCWKHGWKWRRLLLSLIFIHPSFILLSFIQQTCPWSFSSEVFWKIHCSEFTPSWTTDIG